MSWKFSANMETSCRRRATTPVQWNLQNSGDVALLLYVWSASWDRKIIVFALVKQNMSDSVGGYICSVMVQRAASSASSP